MGFVETQFPTDISYGSSGGPEYATDIVVSQNGHEQRNINWSEARARYNVAHGVKTKAQLDTLIAFFRARKGRAYGFRFKDWTDYKVIDQPIATANAALIGDEIIQFGDVTVINAQHVRLSRLLRGRLGTQWASSAHVASERFVLLNDTLRAVPLSTQDIGQTIGWHVVTAGLTELDATSQSMQYRARALMPYAPVHLQVHRNSAGDVLCSWKRCTRGQGEWRDGVDVPLNEANERYGLEIWADSTLVHQTQVTSPSYTYSHSQQMADIGEGIGAFELKIWQISDVVGKGYLGIKNFPA